MWSPSRTAGLEALGRFLPVAGADYARSRNTDRGAGRHHNVSTLSPWIRHRLVSEEEVARAVLGRFSLSASEKFIQEVFWRTYWKGWLEMRPTVWTGYLEEVAALRRDVEADPQLSDRVAAATAGSTGIACFDAWARELLATGYLHNHARMWFASIWIFTLELPWQLGADFFLCHLLDGDPASNTLSWRWVAGIQTRGKTYLARADNIRRFTESRFDPAADHLASRALPVEAPVPPPPKALPTLPTIELAGRVGLLTTEEDLTPDWLMHRIEPESIAILNPSAYSAESPVSARVQRFKETAVADAAARLNGFGPGPEIVVDAKSDPTTLIDWARARGLSSIATPYVPVGSAGAWLDRQETALSEAGIRLIRIMRDWDRLAWPHATKGFFVFKNCIPAVLAELAIDTG